MVTGRMRKRRGAAILLAMLLTAVVASLSTAMLWRHWRNIEAEIAERTRLRAEWILTGALDWGRLVLSGDAGNSAVDHLDEPWAVPLAEARLATFLAAGENADEVPDLDAFLSGGVEDLQARFNLLNLTHPNSAVVDVVLQRLFERLQLPSGEAPLLAHNLRRAWNALTAVQVEEDDVPMLPQRVEQLIWLGISEDSAARLAPFVSLLPTDGFTPINLNTAPEEVLYAVLIDTDRAQAQRLINLRRQTPFMSVAEAVQRAGIDGTEIQTDLLTVRSNFFEVRGALRLEGIGIEETAAVQRGGQGRRRSSVVPLWRRRSLWTPDDVIAADANP